MLEYENRYCAFVDILGFKELVRRTNVQSIHSILESIRKLPVGRDGELVSESNLRFHFFSDNICISTALTRAGIAHMLLSLESLAMELLTKSTLLRGGVVKGPLFHDDDHVFGEALIRAVELESSVARFPRIVLARDVAMEARSYLLEEFGDNIVQQAVDGPFYFDFLGGMQEALDQEEGRTVWATYYNEIAKGLQSALDESADNPNHFEKHIWFARYWNAALGDRHKDVKRLKGPTTDEITWTTSD